jgi:putative heme-binding domain-containing protein
VAFSLGAWPPDRAEPVLAALADGADEEMRVAVLSSLSPGSALFRRLDDPGSVPVAAPLPQLRPTSPNRAKVIAQYKDIDTLTGDGSKGAEYFEALCVACHRFDGRGQAVGPDLDMTANKPTEWLLAAILDPAQTVESRYRGWNVTRTDGTAVAGVVAAETSNNLVLRLPGGTDHPVLRGEIKTMEPIPGSLMPEGFESALPPPAMADLLRFVRGGR